MLLCFQAILQAAFFFGFGFLIYLRKKSTEKEAKEKQISAVVFLGKKVEVEEAI